MTYTLYEQSAKSGQPYFLYLFDDGVNQTRLTSNPTPLTKMGETWTPSSIAHSALTTSGNVEKNNTELTFPISDPLAQSFLSTGAPRVTTFTMWRGHHGDIDEEHRVVDKGKIAGAKSTGVEIVVTSVSALSSMLEMGLRQRFQRTCIYAVYRPGCNLDIGDFYVAATVTATSGGGYNLTIPEAASEANGWYKAGVVNFGGVMGFVENHTGTAIKLLTRIAGLEEYVDANGSAAVQIARGCLLTLPICDEKFGNSINYGGYWHFPDKNPFSVGII